MGGTVMRKSVVVALLTIQASRAVADDLPLRPESCERAATVQYDNCSIVNIFRCSTGAAFWIESLDSDNILTIETRNADHGSTSISYVGQGASMHISQSTAHPRDTIRNGAASDKIVGLFGLFGMSRPISGETNYSHSGETDVLAGETLARIDFAGSVSFPPPMSEIKGSGTILYSDRLDLLIEEKIRFEIGSTLESYSLVHLSLPGQKGFGDETPGYGCGELSLMSRTATEAPT
jgi:hypothetical protein